MILRRDEYEVIPTIFLIVLFEKNLENDETR